MTAETHSFVRTWHVRDREVTLSIPFARRHGPMEINVVWSPDMPLLMSDSDWTDYRKGRDAALKDLCERLGAPDLLAEMAAAGGN